MRNYVIALIIIWSALGLRLFNLISMGELIIIGVLALILQVLLSN